jgi:hypothetical protein
LFPWITRALDGRLYEWAIATPTLALAVELTLWPEMLRGAAFQWVSDYPNVFVATVLVVSFMRMIALAINGKSPVVGPVTRSLCAFASAIMWAQFSYSLYLNDIPRGYPAFGTSYWVSFCMAEIYVSYRAIMDVRDT